MNLSWKIYSAMLGGALLWCAAIVLAPLLLAAPGQYDEMLYAFFHRICHQIDDRSFHLAGNPLAVCVRCSSIYAGFLLATIAWPLFRKPGSDALPSRTWLLLATIPMLVDVCAGAIGLHNVDTISRAVTGLLFGLVLPWYIIPAAIEAAHQLRRDRKTVSFTTENQINA